ncbi:MAG TPA: aminopeptidase P N-terminal domain-containing protein [Verrucomicrobiales bacterium]|jgi:Xaa-Pro aminopeptidase|nr:aminopeptidase P N-terminal domain-containing protein [Verrucomicrobiales bacterium]
MKYHEIPSALFRKNRLKLITLLPENSIAVFHSADLPWRSADGTMPFLQSSDLFYLSGIDQEETILLLAPGHPDPALREVLFVRETSDLIAIWEGHKVTRTEAEELSGISTVRWTSEFEAILRRVMRIVDTVYLNHNEHSRSGSPVNFSLDDRFRRHCQDLYPDHRYCRVAPLMHGLRVVKETEEIALTARACEITAKGFDRVLKFVRPGIFEYEIEAEFLHEFVRHGSRGFAYQPIIASGGNANILHYISNDQVCRDGDLLLMDVAAEYANYNSDLTRTIPVNGKFSPRQRAVYDAVLRILRLCIDTLIVPGKHLRKEYHPEVARAMEDELISLGLIDAQVVAKERSTENLAEEKRAYRRYFMHGVSHSLGLDVHDVAPAETVFVEDMIVTVEPGIYLPEEGFGIRLENDIIVKKSGNIDLMASIPIEAEEIESLMAAKA